MRNALADRARQVVRLLARAYPDARLALDFTTPLELLIALVLAAQFRDDRVNAITPALFCRYRSARDYAEADPAELEGLLRQVNFYRQKTRAVLACTRALVEHFDGEVPRELDALVSLPHVGRKTANILRGNAFGIPAIGVDRHVLRVSQRLGLTKQSDPDRVEADLTPIVKPADQVRFCYLLQAHGRVICLAREPLCEECVLLSLCPFGQSRKAKPKRVTAAKARATSGKAKAGPRRAQSGRRTSAPTKSRRTSGTRTDPSRS